MTQEFDSYRPPKREKRFRKFFGQGGKRKKRGRGGEDLMVDEAQFESYYGRPIVKAPPWKHEIGAYLVLGGIAGGSALLAAGAHMTGLHELRRNARLTALGAISAGAVALIADLGRPERFLNMMRTVKVTSPMSLGSWILGGFSTGAGVAAAAEVVRMLEGHIPGEDTALVKAGKRTLFAVETPAGFLASALGAPLAVYTAALLSNTAVPTWNAARRGLPFVFASSASLAAGGAAMVTTSPAQAGPARLLALMGVAGDLIALTWTKKDMHPLEAEPLEIGHAGKLMHLSEACVIAGGVGTALVGRNRVGAIVSGACLVAGSALTRFGVMDAGHASTQDPKYVVEPQKARLRARQQAGITHDSIVT